MKTVRLYGELGKLFGPRFDLAVDSPAEAIRALCVIRPGFRQYLNERLDAPFRVLVDKVSLDLNGLHDPVGQMETIKLVPVVAGAKDGFGQILVGAALIAAAIWIPGGSAFADVVYSYLGAAGVTAVGTIGWSLAIGGVAQLMARSPEAQFDPSAGSNDKETFGFSSPTLTVGQGGCVPLGYGRMRIGGHVISSGVDAQAWQKGGFGELCASDDGVRYGNGDSIPWAWSIAP